MGEVADTRKGVDDLFVRHTHLTTIIGITENLELYLGHKPRKGE